jgi:hypothetical protein
MLSCDDEIYQWGSMKSSRRPTRASILHFDGPLAFQLVDGGWVRRGSKPRLFRVILVTPGLGKDVCSTVSHDIAPLDVAPVAELAFPSKVPGGQAVKARYELKDRC